MILMKILVLAGGLSPEHDVSMSSGSLIANALREAGHKVLLVDLYAGIDEKEENLELLFQGKSSGSEYTYEVSEKAPNLEEMDEIIKQRKPLVGRNVLKLCSLSDVVFIALHGASGENGQVQAMFDMLGIRYTGTNYAGCLLAMDKDLTKQLLSRHDILTAKWITRSADKITEEQIISEIGLPCVIKPCSAGSSIGISIVENRENLRSGLAAAKGVDAKILVEQKIIGREFSVGILDGKALPVIEIIPKQGFYDYRNKYQLGLTDEITPADLSEALTQEVQELALHVHQILELGSYSRIDFILDTQGQFYCLEANTLPGMTPTSLLPKEAAAVGITYMELCDQIANMPV